jgi:hypothetical protein
MSGAIPPLPTTPSCRGDRLKHKENYTFFNPINYYHYHINFCYQFDSVGFLHWCVAIWIIEFLDFVHCLLFK